MFRGTPCMQMYRPHTGKLQIISSIRPTLNQGIRIKGKEMALVWHEKASRTALQTSSVKFTLTLLVQAHNMTTVKEIAEQCRKL